MLNFAGVSAASVPGAPTIGTATISGTTATVPFTAPASNGGSVITSYTATSTPGGITGTLSQAGSGSVVVSGLTGGTAYTFKVKATNAIGTGPESAASNSVTAITTGQISYTSVGLFTFVAPAGVTSVSVVAIGAGGYGAEGGWCSGSCFCPISGGGGGGGGLAYRNNYAVTPGGSYCVNLACVGSSGGLTGSWFVSTANLMGRNGASSGGTGGGSPGSSIGPGGASGGTGGCGRACPSKSGGGGGGAGGYSGSGGVGGRYTGACTVVAATAGSGGGGGGGGIVTSALNTPIGGGGGGGVGALGSGCSGAGGVNGSGGGGGSSGGSGTSSSGTGGNGGQYGGGGGGGKVTTNGLRFTGGTPQGGIVRIIYPGNTRSFPSTNTGNL